MTRHARPFLVLETGRPVPSMRRHGGFPHWIRTAAGLARGELEAVDVQSGDVPSSHRDYAGVLVTGSGAMVSDREAWSERAADWLRDAAHDGANTSSDLCAGGVGSAAAKGQGCSASGCEKYVTQFHCRGPF